MHTTHQLLDAAKDRLSVSSDYKLAQALGIAQARISGYRIGKSFPDDAVAQVIADAAGLDRGYVVACIHAERAANEETRSLWQGIAARLQAAAAVFAAVILSAGLVASPDASAMVRAPSQGGQDAAWSVYYVNRLCGITC